MQRNPTERSSPRLMQLLTPEAAGAIAATAITWLKAPPYLPHGRKSAPRPLSLPSASLGKMGNLEARLATEKRDVRHAQKLRYKVFYKDGGAIADAATLLARRDKDAFDKICDHVLVVDHAGKPTMSGKPPVVGTYRLLPQAIADRHGGFYTESEFEIGNLIARHPESRFLELGRSCVLPRYRNKRTVELLWQGIWNYVRQQQVDVMFGCASFEGTDPDKLALPLSFLHHYAAATPEWNARAQASRYVEMNRMPKEAITPKAAMQQLPPLIKGYLRLGAMIGEGAVIDYQFGTTDVLIVLPVAAIKGRYIEHFSTEAA